MTTELTLGEESDEMTLASAVSAMARCATRSPFDAKVVDLDDHMKLALTVPAASGTARPEAILSAGSDRSADADVILASARTARRHGQALEATAKYVQACRLFHQLGDQDGVVACLESIAGVAVGSRAEWATRLFGAATALREAQAGSVSGQRRDWRREWAPARQRLSFQVFSRALAEGAALSEDQAVALACGDEAMDLWHRLTRAERAVATLVAEGLTNNEVGGRLGVSSRTVQAHLTHAFGKLGVSSRTALAREVNQRLLPTQSPSRGPKQDDAIG